MNDENEKKPCCTAAASRLVQYITVNGKQVGISHLDTIFEETDKVDYTDELSIREKLLELTKIYNYVPSTVEKQYENVLFEEFKKRKDSIGI